MLQRVSGAAVYTKDILYAWPFLVGENITLDRLGIRVTGAAANSKTRIGIYTTLTLPGLYPSVLVVESGEFDTSTTGVKTATISATLTGGGLKTFDEVLGYDWTVGWPKG